MEYGILELISRLRFEIEIENKIGPFSSSA